MTEQEKKVLTGLCKIEIRRWKDTSEIVAARYYMIELLEIALASLTAKPVKLPDTCGYEHPEKEEPFYTLNKDEVIAAICAAGYQVAD